MTTDLRDPKILSHLSEETVSFLGELEINLKFVYLKRKLKEISVGALMFHLPLLLFDNLITLALSFLANFLPPTSQINHPAQNLCLYQKHGSCPFYEAIKSSHDQILPCPSMNKANGTCGQPQSAYCRKIVIETYLGHTAYNQSSPAP